MGTHIIPTGGITRISQGVGTRLLRINTGLKGTIISLKSHYNQPQKSPQQVEESTNDMLKKILIDNQQLRPDNQQLRTEFRNIERQIGQLAAQQNTRHAGAHPTEKEIDESEKTLIARPPPPSPQRLQKKSDDRMFNKFLDMLSQIQLNLPLIDMLCEIPKYAKYIKDVMANKRRLTEFEIVALSEECTSRIQRKMPQKLKNMGASPYVFELVR
ncbi:PREDICTED: uncharacterized protein LOC109213649 [Nicotiana attenuata]|uniref:uncharacterized protein LOC109213649 n=1 Tax=Nicotiana attenuata TaxID=49451 RepID=UPI00090507D0|nr:PREDICTED: uncharacterized protein LOC109213649 [Nicotiana attenuata]